jgi:hypothetical protein
MLNDPYITTALGILLVALLLRGIFWIEDKMQSQVDEAFARIDAMGNPDHLRESEAVAIQWEPRDQLVLMYELRDHPPKNDAELDSVIDRMCMMRGVDKKNDTEGYQAVLCQIRSWLV